MHDKEMIETILESVDIITWRHTAINVTFIYVSYKNIGINKTYE